MEEGAKKKRYRIAPGYSVGDMNCDIFYIYTFLLYINYFNCSSCYRPIYKYISLKTIYTAFGFKTKHFHQSCFYYKYFLVLYTSSHLYCDIFYQFVSVVCSFTFQTDLHIVFVPYTYICRTNLFSKLLSCKLVYMIIYGKSLHKQHELENSMKYRVP